jgi:hypothetical protein
MAQCPMGLGDTGCDVHPAWLARSFHMAKEKGSKSPLRRTNFLILVFHFKHI